MLLCSPYGTVGVDEAGRGCLAGPVVAGAVMLPEELPVELAASLDDSKRLTAGQRARLRPLIEHHAVAWAVAAASPAEIDQLNILWASVLAMHRALDKICEPGARSQEHSGHIEIAKILVDGNRFRPYIPGRSKFALSPVAVPHECIVGGDGKWQCIAAASILAKTHRDALMEWLDVRHPGYGWSQNKGYPTRGHYEALRRLGPTVLHRKTFRLGIRD